MRHHLKILAVMLAAGTITPVISNSAAYYWQRKVDFVRDIQPIFQANCYQCHGADMGQSQLRFINKTSAMRVIIPGNSRESRLMHRILGAGGESIMPMGGQPLKPEEVDLIRQWIDQGAEWPESASADVPSVNAQSAKPRHWAYIPPSRPPLPTVENKTGSKNPIDGFILAQLKRLGLAPAPEAAKETLIRRLSLDLTGLPPTIEEIDAFLSDQSSEAYEKLVERLLASPHYGERWGRWWLDAARYADTNGFEKDLPRSIWAYRDWVINAFNRDMPFDQFTIEQLAGDLLPLPTHDQRIATGFLRNSMLNQEGGVDPEQFRVEGIIDRVDTIGKAFLGLTIACAQCHTHKFDPIDHREYYQFFAFLNSDDEPEIEVPDAKVLTKRGEIEAAIAKIEDGLIAQTPDLTQRLAEWERKARYDESQWTVLDDTTIFAAFGTKFDKLEDGSFLAKGDNSTSNNYKITARTKLTNVSGFRLELLTDQSLPRGGPGRATDGSLFVSEFSVEAAPMAEPESVTKVSLADPTADFERPDFPVKNVIDADFKTHWSSDAGPGRLNLDRKMVFVAGQPVGFDGGTILTVQVAQKSDPTISLRGGKPNIGRFRIAVTQADKPYADPLPAGVRRILAVPAGQRTKEQQREVFGYYRTTIPEWAEANGKIDELMKTWPYGPTTLALAPRHQLRETRIFRRGDWKRPAEPVTPGTPAILHPLPQEAPRNRLGLARWIVDAHNPLTARVIVNRIWQQYFGAGLVTTPEDFGSRCEPPSHPELLDWLAVEFREKGWSMKHMHRLIVTSAVYRQSSRVTPQLLEADPANRWLARAPRLRVEAEVVRDIALSASGLLSRRVGGPSVFPPIPDGVMTLSFGTPMKWETSTGEDRYRRAMYTFWKRSVPYPSLLVFDAPNADAACTRRIRSDTPLQALTTLNDQVFMEAAQALALRVWKEGGADDRAKMIHAFRLCTGRRPDDFELQHLLSLLREQQAYFTGRTGAAVYVSAADLNNLPLDIDLHQVAPWTIVARVLLNLDETIAKE